MSHRCVFCLYDLPLFKGLDTPAFGQVCIQATKLHVSRGQYVFRQGEPATTVYLVKVGSLKLVQVTDEGREVIADMMGPGEVVGETALFQEQEYPFSAVALEASSICCFNRQQFEAMIRKNPDVAMQIIGYLAHRLYENIRQAGEKSGASVREKVLQLLTRLAEKYGRAMPGATVIELDITQQEIADMIGASRVMVANSLKQLHQEGIVCRRGRHYLLNVPGCAMIPVPAPAREGVDLLNEKERPNERNPEDDSCPPDHPRRFLRTGSQ